MNSVSNQVANQLRFVNTYGSQRDRICGNNMYTPLNTQEESKPKKKKKKKKEKFDYSINDGKISPGQKIKNFIKGLFSPVTTMFKSPKNFIFGAATIAAGAALIAATGGAAAPVMAAGGIVFGALKFVVSAHKAAHAKTDEEAKKAWRGMGAGAVTVAGSVVCAKPALKAAGIQKGQDIGVAKSVLQCFKYLPDCVSRSFNAFKFGQASSNLKNFFNFSNDPNGDFDPIGDLDDQWGGGSDILGPNSGGSNPPSGSFIQRIGQGLIDKKNKITGNITDGIKGLKLRFKGGIKDAGQNLADGISDSRQHFGVRLGIFGNKICSHASGASKALMTSLGSIGRVIAGSVSSAVLAIKDKISS